MNGGYYASVFLVVLIWTQDTAAYAVGRAFGKHRLAPAISPKKSWEGSVGGSPGGGFDISGAEGTLS
jgi:phosphatidate cytidylyltransferase